MAEETPYWVQLQRQVKELEDNYDVRGAEIQLLQSEITDLLRPMSLLVTLQALHMEMLSELVDWCKDKKPTEKILASKARLLRLIEIDSELNNFSGLNQTLKANNRELFGKLQLLRVENANLRKELNKITESDKF